jgi:hypothetical protein
MKHTFALTTRQVAKLGKTEIPPIYMALKRYGEWRGVRPRKTNSGRLLWPSDEVHSALGIVPSIAEMTNAERFFCQFLEDEALPLTGEAWAIIRGMLSSKADEGRDPSIYINEATLLVEIISAFANRLDQVLPTMDETSQKRAFLCLEMIASTAKSFSDKEIDCA